MTTGTVEGEFIATMDDPDDPEMFERNRIHTTAGAQEYGFKGAFVGGVTLYAWCAPTIIDARISTTVISIPYRRLHFGQDA